MKVTCGNRLQSQLVERKAENSSLHWSFSGQYLELKSQTKCVYFSDRFLLFAQFDPKDYAASGIPPISVWLCANRLAPSLGVSSSHLPFIIRDTLGTGTDLPEGFKRVDTGRMSVAPSKLDSITTHKLKVNRLGIGWNENLVWIAESVWPE